ncbi:MAG: hypothetical protein LBG60_09110, partial [Bifidobacteriaceae bacterium]|nr:hypothetical protein [Bifidobacteriaceae bacterium]
QTVSPEDYESSLAWIPLRRLRPDQIEFLFELWGGIPEAPRAITPDEALPATRSYAWLADQIGPDGLALTSGGHLPPSVVKRAYDELGWTAQHAVHGYNETSRVRISALRSAAERLGLVYVSHNRMRLTDGVAQAAADQIDLWNLMVSRVPQCWSSEIERDVTILLLLGAAVGAGHRRDLVKDAAVWAVEAIGWRSSRSGAIPSVREVSNWGHHIKNVLHSMDALTWRGWKDPEDIKPHGVLFARAVLALRADQFELN